MFTGIVEEVGHIESLKKKECLGIDRQNPFAESMDWSRGQVFLLTVVA